MRRRLSLLLLGTLGLTVGGGAIAADLQADRAAAAQERLRVPVVVDDLFLQHPRCRTDKDCIAPRILPIEGGRRLGVYRSITVTADPRFVEHYR